jgi:hypothetical protein
MNIENADAYKILDTLRSCEAFFRRRDEMNAEVHLARAIRYSPLTSQVEAQRERLERLLSDAGATREATAETSP